LKSLGKYYRAELGLKYPHLMPEDRKIWTRFIDNGKYIPDKVWYDIRVGMAVELPSGQPEWMTKFAEYSTRKRIDMVWFMGGRYWVVEAKPRAGVVALGQVIFYGVAFEAEYQPTEPVERAIITDIVDEDLISIFDALGIVCFEVGM